jgi:hypothetical protein
MDHEILVEDCVSGQSLIRELRSSTREGDMVTTIVPTDERPGDVGTASVSRDSRNEE